MQYDNTWQSALCCILKWRAVLKCVQNIFRDEHGSQYYKNTKRTIWNDDHKYFLGENNYFALKHTDALKLILTYECCYLCTTWGRGALSLLWSKLVLQQHTLQNIHRPIKFTPVFALKRILSKVLLHLVHYFPTCLKKKKKFNLFFKNIYFGLSRNQGT